jgi:hypothetical protein
MSHARTMHTVDNNSYLSPVSGTNIPTSPPAWCGCPNLDQLPRCGPVHVATTAPRYQLTKYITIDCSFASQHCPRATAPRSPTWRYVGLLAAAAAAAAHAYGRSGAPAPTGARCSDSALTQPPTTAWCAGRPRRRPATRQR